MSVQIMPPDDRRRAEALLPSVTPGPRTTPPGQRGLGALLLIEDRPWTIRSRWDDCAG